MRDPVSKTKNMSGMVVVRAFNPSPAEVGGGRKKQVDFCEFKSNLDYIVNSRTVRAM